MHADFVERLRRRLAEELPGRAAQSRFEPELGYGRHFARAPSSARQAAVLALLYPHGDAWYLPLTERPATLALHAGQISLPGGMLEAGESGPQAALRELREELGIREADVDLLGALSPLYLYVSNFQISPYVAVTSHRPTMTPSVEEVAGVIELPLATLLDPAAHGRHSRRLHGIEFSAPHINAGGRFIWGATSMILGELIEIVGKVHAAG